MNTLENNEKMREEKLKLRNSRALFEFYRSLNALHVVLVRYVQGDYILKTKESDKEVEVNFAEGADYSSQSIESLDNPETTTDLRDFEERAKEVTVACQILIRAFSKNCPDGGTWDEATGTCN
jgi:hypothetical protein